MHLFQGHRTSSEPLWHVGLPPLFTQAYIHSLHRFLAHFMICDDYFMISSGFPLFEPSYMVPMDGVLSFRGFYGVFYPVSFFPFRFGE